jgi:Predicted transcriptional regulator
MHNGFVCLRSRGRTMDAMVDYLRQEMECYGLMECFHGLKILDREVFEWLVTAEAPQTVDAIAAAVDRERSTAYRSVQRLIEAGFLEREQVNYEQGGYYHVFAPRDPDEIADEMLRVLNDWYAKMGQLIDEFREEYELVGAESATAHTGAD